jgi:retron-type reverse transcriptase
MPSSGTWLLNVIWTKVQPRSAETDFQTTFSSLSFGFPPNGSP